MNKSRGGYKIHVRKAEDEDHTLEQLYDQSEFAKKKHQNKDKAASSIDDDISDFLDAEENNEKFQKQQELKEKSSSKKSRKQKEKREKSKNRAKDIIFAIFIIAVLAGCASFGFFALNDVKTSEETSDLEHDKTVADSIYYSPLTGLEVANADITKSAATCVMIENSLEARPQSGLSEAGVVYESIAEGGITRFMAIFQEAKPSLIGPVRSVRLTFAEFAKPYHCSIAHVGGSGNALNLIRNNGEFRDIDQFYNDSSYWRANSKPNGRRIYAPHNVYTNFERLDALNFRRGYSSSEFTGFYRIDPDAPASTAEKNATTINIKISSNTFNPVYHYDANTNSYLRSFASGQAHNSILADGKEVQNAPKVVIALKTNAVTRTSERQYSDYTTIGENDAFIFQNGTVVAGKWVRKDANSELQFYDKENNRIELNRGQVWISIYPSNSGSVTWE